jgi:crossover junction endodeoxyribonuclease RusA
VRKAGEMIRVELPFPPAELNPNRKNGRHWGATHAVKDGYKRDCWALTLAAVGAGCIVPDGDIALRLTFVQPDKRHRDRDNLLAASKALLDGFAAALKVDDSRFEPVTICRQYGKKPGAVIVEALT